MTPHDARSRQVPASPRSPASPPSPDLAVGPESHPPARTPRRPGGDRRAIRRSRIPWVLAGLCLVAAPGLAQSPDLRPIVPDHPSTAPHPAAGDHLDASAVRTLADTLPRITLGRLGAAMRLGWGGELGVEFEGRSGEESPEGVRILRVRPMSPAEEGDLREDDLIVSYEGQRLTEPLARGEDELDPDMDPPAARFLHLTRELEPGDTIRIQIRRDGVEEVRELVARTRFQGRGLVLRRGEGPQALFRGDVERIRARGAFPRVEPLVFRGDTVRPPEVRLRFDGDALRFQGDTILVWPPTGPRIPDVFRQLMPGVQRFGLRLHDMDEELGRYFDGVDGVLVLSVADDAPLALEAGDVIVAIDGRHVSDAAHAGRIFQSYESGEEISVEIRRLGRVLTVEGTTP